MVEPGVLLWSMPGQRDPSQTTMTVSMSKKFLDMVDDVCRRVLRGTPRAALVREALEDYLKSKHQIVLPLDDVLPPSRSVGVKHAVVMEEPSKPAAEPRKEVKYSRPSKRRKTS